MILLPYSRPWEQQPDAQTATRSDWVRLYTPTASGRHARISGPAIEPSAAGSGYKIASAGAFNQNEIVPGISSGITVVLIAQKVAKISGNSDFIFGEHETSVGGYNWGFYESLSSGSMSWFVHNGSSAASCASTQWTTTAGPQIWVGTFGDGDPNVRLYLNGGLESSTALTGSVRRLATAYLRTCQWQNGTPNFVMLAAAVAARRFPAEEVREKFASLGSAWHAMFEPQRIWVPVSAGGGINASVTLTGCSAASAAGATVALGSATAALSGASSAASAGTVTASAGSSASITLSGASSASAAGSLLATAGATAVLSGTSSASAAGAVAASAGASVTVVGSAASSAAGALTATAGGNAVATLTGASATSTAGSLTAGGSAGISLAGVGAAGAAGAVTATAGGAASVTLTGASASAAAGILAGFGGAQITLTGASASGAAGSASASAGSGSGTGATAAEIWSYTLSNGLTAEATVVAIHTMLSELHLIHGLTAGSPLSVTAASRAAGAVSQAVAEAAGTVTVTRQ